MAINWGAVLAGGIVEADKSIKEDNAKRIKARMEELQSDRELQKKLRLIEYENNIKQNDVTRKQQQKYNAMLSLTDLPDGLAQSYALGMMQADSKDMRKLVNKQTAERLKAYKATGDKTGWMTPEEIAKAESQYKLRDETLRLPKYSKSAREQAESEAGASNIFGRINEKYFSEGGQEQSVPVVEQPAGEKVIKQKVIEDTIFKVGQDRTGDNFLTEEVDNVDYSKISAVNFKDDTLNTGIANAFSKVTGAKGKSLGKVLEIAGLGGYQDGKFTVTDKGNEFKRVVLKAAYQQLKQDAKVYNDSAKDMDIALPQLSAEQAVDKVLFRAIESMSETEKSQLNEKTFAPLLANKLQSFATDGEFPVVETTKPQPDATVMTDAIATPDSTGTSVDKPLPPGMTLEKTKDSVQMSIDFITKVNSGEASASPQQIQKILENINKYGWTTQEGEDQKEEVAPTQDKVSKAVATETDTLASSVMDYFISPANAGANIPTGSPFVQKQKEVKRQVTGITGKDPLRDMTKEEVADMQRILTENGFDTKGVDGIIGPNTTAAVNDFLSLNGATEKVDADNAAIYDMLVLKYEAPKPEYVDRSYITPEIQLQITPTPTLFDLTKKEPFQQPKEQREVYTIINEGNMEGETSTDVVARMQQVVGADADGKVGPQTLAKMREAGVIEEDDDGYVFVKDFLYKDRVFAAGKYQVIPDTLYPIVDELIKRGEITLDDKFSSQNQEKVMDYLLENDLRDVKSYIETGKGDIKKAITSMSKTFASIPKNEKNEPYKKDGANKVQHTYPEVVSILQEAVKNKDLSIVKKFIASGESNSYDDYNSGVVKPFGIIKGKMDEKLTDLTFREMFKRSSFTDPDLEKEYKKKYFNLNK
jgi:peptidoglycan hydrolase-like protein with peptidoglycan-binding domain